VSSRRFKVAGLGKTKNHKHLNKRDNFNYCLWIGLVNLKSFCGSPVSLHYGSIIVHEVTSMSSRDQESRRSHAGPALLQRQAAPNEGYRTAISSLDMCKSPDGRSIGGGDPVRSLREFAALAGISIATLRRMIKSGDGPVITRMSPRRIGIRCSHGDAWLEARAGAQTAA
jgi:hypothetical protein